ncbi:hypothetical protein HS088_TW21G01157 [Tripterygium wilfordii]|uniref:PB1-like domain-containing protein n=1 Tax=Tripterygium wilfordii TaxID=458696 RepID=A0A7J7C4C6_TRIWF|nr:hypothetical protein HS088_TW21G01157 [Tripterygium wilfordii]
MATKIEGVEGCDVDKQERMNNLFDLMIRHGETLQFFPFETTRVRYVGGCVDEWKDCNPDVMSVYVIAKFVKQMGYEGYNKSYFVFLDSELENGLKNLTTDGDDVREMILAVTGHKKLHIYIGHHDSENVLANDKCDKCVELIDVESGDVGNN